LAEIAEIHSVESSNGSQDATSWKICLRQRRVRSAGTECSRARRPDRPPQPCGAHEFSMKGSYRLRLQDSANVDVDRPCGTWSQMFQRRARQQMHSRNRRRFRVPAASALSFVSPERSWNSMNDPRERPQAGRQSKPSSNPPDR
jgi:hypothetical protein